MNTTSKKISKGMNTSKKLFNSPSRKSPTPLSGDNNVTYNRNHLKRKGKLISYVEPRDADLNVINVEYKRAKCRQSDLKVNAKGDKEPNEKTFMCVICQKSYELVRSLVKHFSKSHKMPSKCSICHERCSTRKQLIEHSLLHPTKPVNPGENFHAIKCGRNKISHEKENFFSCEFCPKMFIREKCLNNHMSIHTKEAHVCKFCEKKFLFNARLVRHLQDVHRMSDSIPESKLLQQHASKTHCIKKENLQQKESPPLQPEENSCVLCNDIFPTSYKLGLHLIEHAEDYEKLCSSSNNCDDSDVEIID